ncbi:hypothetical protein R1sor_005729 [Riccia sorocarpa]|uniref:Uncharacterized protein n=1 Tax=Riccia sorocarpa TaxID=122646 RepID=A0ABD3HKY5_9MARC
MESDRTGTMEADVSIVADYRQDCSHIVESGFSSTSKKSPDSCLGDLHPLYMVLGERLVTTKIGGQVMTKGKAFSVMTAKLPGIHGFPHLQGDELKKKYERYFDLYKRAREWLAETGSGLTEEEISLGYTNEKNMHEKCPHFYRMNAIFGNRANVNPPALGSLGLGSEEIPTVVDSQLPGIEECQTGVEIPEESRNVEENHADDFLAEEFYVDAEPTDGDEEVHTEHA